MPMFDYKCENCNTIFDELVPSSDTPDTHIVCPKCKEKQAKRLLSAPAVSVGGSQSVSSGGGCNPSSGFS
ncbi:MAG: zinc ribbon domain-containing protein [Candidatus Marinimicrobia bacterium]|nr:zinc ribbon domain-containing protein [Candidatus Neomarinimicrobiota bacterium]